MSYTLAFLGGGDYVMTSDFTQAVVAVIPVIILAAVIEGNAYAKQALDILMRERQEQANVRAELLTCFQRGEEPPVALAQRYCQVMATNSKEAMRGHWTAAALWTFVVLQLSVTEVMDLTTLMTEEEERMPALAYWNMMSIGMGFLLLIGMPLLTRLLTLETDRTVREWTSEMTAIVLRRASETDSPR
ncbi:hypothetical protein [Streptomyces sp. NPDC049744]|uniref:hypothetical protein n=1 Tax=Streptomyces sp. NPDC049744 TaxID=3154359 RepID=UPI00341D3F6B